MDKPVKVFGVGRICVDKFYYLVSDVSRVQSKKQSIKFAGQQIGGSIPRILSCLANDGYEAVLISNGSADEIEKEFVVRELAYVNVAHKLKSIDKLPESVLLYDSGNKLISILSVIENGHQLLSESDIEYQELNLFNPELIVLDIRHCDAAINAAKWARMNNKVVFLDTGSSTMYKLSSPNCNEAEILKYCDIICSSEEFYREFCTGNDIKSIFDNHLFVSLKLVICTLSNGLSIVASKDYGFSISRVRDVSICNSLGTGDIYKGFFLSCFMKHINSAALFEESNIELAIKTAIAAATVQIESTELFCNIPSINDVENVLALLAFNKINSTQFYE